MGKGRRDGGYLEGVVGWVVGLGSGTNLRETELMQ